MIFIRFLVVAVLISCFSINAWGRDVPQIPISAVSAGLIKKELAAPPSAPQLNQAQVKTPATHAPTVFEGAEKIKLRLVSVTIEGNTVYSTPELEKFFTPLLNRDISLADLQTAVYNVTLKYRQAGYVLSRAYLPPQEIDQKAAKAHVRIVEGFISEVSITGTPGRLKSLLQQYGEQVAKTRPFQIKVLEHYLFLANDLSGLQVRSILTPSATESGGAVLNLIGTKVPGEGYVFYDNYGTRYLGPQQLTIGGNANSVFVPGDNNVARFLITPNQPRELNFMQFVHIQPLGVSGLQWQFGGSFTKTHPGFLLEPLHLVGESKSVTTDLSYPIVRTRTQNLSVHMGANYEDDSSMLLNEALYIDHLRVLIVGGSYDLIDSLRGSNSIRFDAQRGFNIWGSVSGGDRSRTDGRSNFTKTTMDISRLQAIGGRFSMLVDVQGQYAFVPLLVSEQFIFGGSVLGRGYDPAELTGDDGIAGKVEVRLDTYPGLYLLKNIQYYVFYDVGQVWNLGKPVIDFHQAAASLGGGVRISLNEHFGTDLFVAKPMTRPVLNEVAAGENGNSPRVYFQLKAFI